MRNTLALAIVAAAACGGSKPPAPPAPPVIRAEKAPPPAAIRPEVPPPPPAGHPATDLIPRAVLFGNPERTAIQLSHDGKWLSWLAPKDNVMNVWIAPVDHLDQAKAITSETKRPIRQYF